MRRLNQRMRQDQLFNQIYKIDAATDCYMIEIGLDQYADIFSEWDPAPFKRRDLDPDLKVYLEGSSEELPLRYPVELCFVIPSGIWNAQAEAETREGLKNSFIFKLYLLRKQIRKTNTQMLQLVLIGFVLLGIATTFSERVADAFLPSILVEGLFISGWVFLWEAVYLFFFTNRELYHHYRTYKRLQRAPVLFRVAEKAE